MKPTWGELREWNPDALEDAASLVKQRKHRLEGLSDDLTGANPEGWQGDAATAARTQRGEISEDFESAGDEAGAVVRALHRATDDIGPLQRKQGDADELARVHNFSIGDDGSITDHGVGPDVPDDQVQAVRAERRQVSSELAVDIDRILEQAREIDRELSSILDRAEDGEIVDAREGDPARLERPLGDSAEEINDWWTGLSQAEQAQVIDEHPNWVGSTDGIPAEARDSANRVVLDEQKQDLLDRRAELEEQLDNTDFSRHGSPERQLIREQIGEVDGKLDGIGDIENRLESTEGAADDQRHYLLGIDTDNAGQAIVATGNPDTADDVATYVPGTGAGLDGVGELLNRGDDMHDVAEQAGSESTSVITWVGYDAPQNVAAEARDEQYTQDATADLAGFQDGLSASHEGPGQPNTTLIGHSYGSTTIGHTARDEDLDVDQMVFVGSPGIGVEHAGDLGVDPDDVYATTARHDIIRMTPTAVHEQQPVADEFEAQTFESDAGTRGILGYYSMDAHSEYWDPGSKSIDNMARIIAGEPLPGGAISAPG